MTVAEKMADEFRNKWYSAETDLIKMIATVAERGRNNAEEELWQSEGQRFNFNRWWEEEV